MNKIRITDADSTYFKICFEIYENSFPLFEQRTLADQIAVLSNTDYYFEVIIGDKKEVLGLLMTWHTADFVYIEHFAISESIRGKNIGSRILKDFMASTHKPMLLEIDPPVDDISNRRKEFYNRLGFVQNDYKHIHPAYRKEQKPHTLVILSKPEITPKLYEEFYSYLMNTIMVYSENKN
ncbi:MAG: hypothetical protein BEN18_08340 [Epulopiscium sp. Nuni2H_MBin001]|nr:MAG: hypothetical protein BEN18_08340 [Epulopiscium sp. Nuni2H_MBin001]